MLFQVGPKIHLSIAQDSSWSYQAIVNNPLKDLQPSEGKPTKKKGRFFFVDRNSFVPWYISFKLVLFDRSSRVLSPKMKSFFVNSIFSTPTTPLLPRKLRFPEIFGDSSQNVTRIPPYFHRNLIRKSKYRSGFPSKIILNVFQPFLLINNEF